MIMTETLVGMSPPSDEDSRKQRQPSAAELEAAREMVRQARDRGVALTGPGGLLKALTKTVIETALDEEVAEHVAMTSTHQRAAIKHPLRHVHPEHPVRRGHNRRGQRQDSAAATAHIKHPLPRSQIQRGD